MMGNRTTSLPSRESEGCRRTGAVVGHFLQSGLWAENRRLTGLFPKISGNVGPISLHFRLYGGEGGIRTFGTALLR
jgi:hypothetical protein